MQIRKGIGQESMVSTEKNINTALENHIITLVDVRAPLPLLTTLCPHIDEGDYVVFKPLIQPAILRQTSEKIQPTILRQINENIVSFLRVVFFVVVLQRCRASRTWLAQQGDGDGRSPS